MASIVENDLSVAETCIDDSVPDGEPQYSLESLFPRSLLKLNTDEDSQYFKQPGAKVDFVLKYVHESPKKLSNEYKCCKRVTMQSQPVDHKKHFDKLMNYVTKLRTEKKLRIKVKEDHEVSGTLYFMVNATFEALKEGAEDLALQKSVEPDTVDQKQENDKRVFLNKHKFKHWYRRLSTSVFQHDILSFMDPPYEKQDSIGCLTVPYIRQRHDKYKNSHNEDKFFTDAERIAITSYFLENPASIGSTYEDGLSELVHGGYLTDAYPLHDKPRDDGKPSDYQVLTKEWSNPLKLYKNQPFENIRQYFGEKIGLYFVWIGYYTYWLVPAAFIGVIVTICGLYTISLDNNPIAREICNESNREFFYMCPRCNDICDFWYYISGCTVARFSLVFDNGGTVFFAVFIMLWANLFIEFWRRRLLLLQFQWDTIEYDVTDEKPLPQFLKRAKKYVISEKSKPDDEVDSNGSRCGRFIDYFRNMFKHQYNVYEVIPNYSVGVWDYYESRFTFWPKLFLTFSAVLTLVFALLGIVIAIIIYRITVSTLIYRIVHRVSGGVVTSNYIVTFSALGLQVVCIFVLNVVYGYIARYLTAWELHRTASDYETSYTIKMYLFYFVNFYSSIFYIAFIKGRFVGYPSNFNRITVFALEQCNSEGCQLELATQMFVIFAIKLLWDNAQQLIKPISARIWIYIKDKRMKKKTRESQTESISLERINGSNEQDDSVEDDRSSHVWKKDDTLAPCDGMLSVGKHSLFYEYLEVVIQYGFVTIFVAAFPLAPLMALFNNIFEIRLDASKFMKIYRRPVPERTNDQAVWLSIIQFVTTLSVITNGLIIAFTSTYIDRLVYQYVYNSANISDLASCSVEDDCSPDRGFVTWSTSSFELKALLEPNGVADKTTDFPLLSILKLPMYENGEIVKRRAVIGRDVGKLQSVLYLPYLDFDCLARNIQNFTFSNFTESEYSYFYSDEDILTGTGICFDQTIQCRFRGQHKPNGAHPLKYYRTLAMKLGIALLFENFIFIAVMVICYIIPDTPYSVKMERRLEKKLTQNLWKGKELFVEVNGITPTST